MLPFPLFALCGVCRCSDGSSIEMRSLELFGAELWSDREFLFGSRWNIEHRIHHYCFYFLAYIGISTCVMEYGFM